jgi:hypothetical protein
VNQTVFFHSVHVHAERGREEGKEKYGLAKLDMILWNNLSHIEISVLPMNNTHTHTMYCVAFVYLLVGLLNVPYCTLLHSLPHMTVGMWHINHNQ